jgi:hypothetical protein
MARKHSSVIINGISVSVSVPGLRTIARPNGGVDTYWYASKKAARAGYTPRTVRLHGDISSQPGLDVMSSRCWKLQAQMLRWLRQGDTPRSPPYSSSVHSLIECYQTDPNSSFHDTRYNTQRGYRTWFTALDKVAGDKKIEDLTGASLREWHRTVRKPKTPGGAPRERLAKAVIQAMRIILAYGREIGLADCVSLSAMIDGIEFRRENDEKRLGKPKPKPKVVMTYGQAEAIVRKGLEIGTHRGRSVALAVAAQFEFTISQIDAIGYWMPARAVTVEPDMVVRGGKVWRPGLRFEDFESGILDLARLKTGRSAQFDVAEYPLFQLALSAVPEDQRRGPLVTDDDDDPVRYRVFYGMYRTVADAAGVPKEVWNARARHGGGTEARASGASIEDTTDRASVGTGSWRDGLRVCRYLMGCGWACALGDILSHSICSAI